MKKNIAVLAGDGIGIEIVGATIKVLKALMHKQKSPLTLSFNEALVGGMAYKARNHPLPEETLTLVKNSDAVLFGAVGDPQFDNIPRALRPEQAILGLRKELKLFANLRPAKVFDSLLSASTIKPEILKGTDMIIVRELLEDLYFGQPRGIFEKDGEVYAINTMSYSQRAITKIGKLAFELAKTRRQKVTSIDKANVLEVSELWRNTVIEISKSYPQVTLSHLYIDNACMQLIRTPRDFDVVLCGNLFGDILSDEAAMLTGSIGLLPSASVNEDFLGLYEPIHGSAPDIAGKDLANPIATILSAAMMFRYSFKMEDLAQQIETAVEKTINQGFRTRELYQNHGTLVGCAQMAEQVIANL